MVRTARNTLVGFIAALLLALPGETGAAEKLPQRPNVLFIAADDLRPQLGCYGDPVPCVFGAHRQAGAADTKRPNVLFIAVDDLNHWVAHLGRNPQAQTPNLDRLAARGVTFSHAYCAVPACEPSRAALLGGGAPLEQRLLPQRRQVEGTPHRGKRTERPIPQGRLLRRRCWEDLPRRAVFTLGVDRVHEHHGPFRDR